VNALMLSGKVTALPGFAAWMEVAAFRGPSHPPCARAGGTAVFLLLNACAVLAHAFTSLIPLLS
jgi:hypothetical protein